MLDVMKKKISFDRVVLILAAAVLLLMVGWFAVEQTKQSAPWRVEVERNDRAEASVSTGHSDHPDSMLGGEVIHLNTAPLQDLERLPGIGRTKAQAIVDYRQEHGPFQSVDDLLQISGIGPGTLEELRPYVTVE